MSHSTSPIFCFQNRVINAKIIKLLKIEYLDDLAVSKDFIKRTQKVFNRKRKRLIIGLSPK
jgi:hypothetical protein